MDQKTVVVTGGNKGIGLEASKLFLSHQCIVHVIARDFSGFDLPDPNVRTVEFDLRNVNAIPELAKRIGHVDVLINNAGIMHGISYDQYTEAKKREMLAINIEAPVAMIEAFAPSMVKQGQGRIVNNASIAGQIGHPDIWYGIAKAGLINVTKSFAKALGPKGIVINAVAAGAVETKMLSTIPQARKDGMLRAAYLERFAQANEVAKVMYWLATDSPEYINGTCIDINNGVFPR